MRLFLLPISSKHTLVYAQRLNRQLVNKQGYSERITAWASNKWTQWEASDNSLQKRITTWGNNALKRIPYQEWGLKSVPPLSARREKEELRGKEQVEAIFPSSIIKPANVQGILHKIATERQALHRKWMWWSIVGIPFSAPVALIPVIPNIPFFYLAFRAWSHWRALAGSKHIEFLLQNGLIKHVESPILSKIYAANTLTKEQLDRLQKSADAVKSSQDKEREVSKTVETKTSTSLVKESGSDQEPDKLCATKQTGKLVSICFGMPQVNMEMERASSQVSALIAKESEEATKTTNEKRQ